MKNFAFCTIACAILVKYTLREDPMEDDLNFKKILKRRQLTQQRFTELTRNAWADISGRSLSRQAVSAWANNREIPTFTPAEMFAVIDVLGCTFAEFVLAFNTRKNKSSEKA